MHQEGSRSEPLQLKCQAALAWNSSLRAQKVYCPFQRVLMGFPCWGGEGGGLALEGGCNQEVSQAGMGTEAFE